jgi:hypothetical protein
VIPPVVVHVTTGIYEGVLNGQLHIATSLDLQLVCTSSEEGACLMDLGASAGVFATITQIQAVSLTGLSIQANSNTESGPSTPTAMLTAAECTSLSLVNCTFFFAPVMGEISCQRGVVVQKDAKLTVDACSFTGLAADRGSALLATQSTDVTVSDTVFQVCCGCCFWGVVLLLVHVLRCVCVFFFFFFASL